MVMLNSILKSLKERYIRDFRLKIRVSIIVLFGFLIVKLSPEWIQVIVKNSLSWIFAEENMLLVLFVVMVGTLLHLVYILNSNNNSDHH